MFWYGDQSLWTMLSVDGSWEALPKDEHGYTQKTFWWADGYLWNEEPQPEFLLTAERLDAKALLIESGEITNAYTDETGSSILTGILISDVGCWQITGYYRGHELSFVVDVKP
ncbi:MAG: hypothetical protein DWG76_00085 [Chloroflexi bacterium]|nr:hypothetical protein [Chloroflexota bacterium]